MSNAMQAVCVSVLLALGARVALAESDGVAGTEPTPLAADAASTVVWIDIPGAIDLGPEPLLVDDVAMALRVRFGTRPIVVAPWAGDTDWGWLLRIQATRAKEIHIWVGDSGGKPLRERSLSTAGRRAADLAHTIALLAVDALQPVMPELADALPGPDLPRLPAPPVVEQGPSRPPTQVWEAGVGLSTALLFPRARMAWAPTLYGHWQPGRFGGELAVGWWALPAVDGTDYRLEISQATLRFGATVQWSVAPLVLSLGVGPSLRWSRARVSTQTIGVETSSFVNFGGYGQGRLALDVGKATVSLVVVGIWNAAFERYRVRGEWVFNTGRVVVESGLGVGWQW